MKKLILLVVTAVVALAGCQKSELVDPIESNDVFTASVEEFSAQTKTALTPGNYVVWSSGDRLAIFQGGTLANEYEITESSAGKTNATFTRVVSSGDHFYAGTELPCNVAFYPYAEGLSLNGDMNADAKKAYTISTVLLPSVQMYQEGSFANGAFPMVAVTQIREDHNLIFKNVLGALKLQLKGTQTVKSIRIEGANGEKLSGAATVTAYANNLAPVIKMASDASETVTLDCGDGVQLSSNEVTNFYIALPPVLFEKGFTVTVTDVHETEYTVTATEANTILRSSVLAMPEISIESEVDEKPEGGSGNSGDYIDEYGINHGPGVEIHRVVWAPVNCGYHATDYKWGKLYQWGRKYGQGYYGDATTPEFSEGGVSLQGGQSENNKNVFYACTDSPYDWLYSQNDALWNSGSEESPVKTGYDPCPEGWRVPTYTELSELYTNRSSWTENDLGQSGYWFSGPSSYSSEAAQVFFPAAGYRLYSGAFASYRRGYGYYWSSSPGNDYAFYLYFYSGDAYMINTLRAYGYSVRCVQDDLSTDTPEDDEEELIIPVESVSLNQTYLKLYEDDSAQLVAKVRPVDATDKSITWSSSDPLVATVDQAGNVTAISVGTAEISAQVGEFVATCSVEVKQKLVINDYVDEFGVNHGPGVAIGMTVWAPVNCGYEAATADYKGYPYGKLYQWGRKYGQGYDSNDATTPELYEGGISLQGGQSKFNENVFFTCPDDLYDWLYSQNNALWNSGTEDSPVKTEYDPCPAGWRVPTYAELNELYRNRSSWTENDLGQNGYWFSVPSSYSSEVAQVFFPAAGFRHYGNGDALDRGYSGDYWSSRPNGSYAYRLSFFDGSAHMNDFGSRAGGYSVRCVQN